MSELSQINHEMKTLVHQTLSLEKLYHVVKNNEYFDEDDHRVLLNKLNHLRRYHVELKKKRIQSLTTYIEQRNHLLELHGGNDVFGQFPEILTYFATKQSDLNNLLEQTKDGIK